MPVIRTTLWMCAPNMQAWCLLVLWLWLAWIFLCVFVVVAVVVVVAWECVTPAAYLHERLLHVAQMLMTENSLSRIAFIVHGTQLVYAFPFVSYEFCDCLGMTHLTTTAPSFWDVIWACCWTLMMHRVSSSLPFPPPGLAPLFCFSQIFNWTVLLGWRWKERPNFCAWAQDPSTGSTSSSLFKGYGIDHPLKALCVCKCYACMCLPWLAPWFHHSGCRLGLKHQLDSFLPLIYHTVRNMIWLLDLLRLKALFASTRTQDGSEF